MIVSERFKSYSIFSEQEAINSLAKEIENFSDEEREAFFTCLTDSEYEREINGLELDREIVGVEQWIEDDYYMGGVGKSIWKPWKDDLVELFESDEYSSAVIVGGIGCAEICLPVMTSEGLIPIGDLSSKPHKYLSFDGSGYKYVQGTQSFPKGKGMLYRVSHDEGEFTVTGNHLVMCADHRYRKVETLSPLTPILSASLQQTQEKNGISYVQLVKGKVLDCLGDHLKDLHCGDELLLLLSNIGLALSPLSNDFQQSSLGKKDGPLKLKLSFDQVAAYLSGHHNMQDFVSQLEVQLSDCLSHSYARISQQSYEFCRHLLQSGTEKDLDRIILKLSAFARQTFLTLPLGSDHREVLQHLSVVDHFFGSTPQRQNLSRHKALQSRSKVLIHLITLLFSSLSPQKSQKVSLVEANSASRHTQLRSMLKYLVSWQGQQRRSCRQSIRSAYLKCLGLVHSPFSQTPLQTSIIRSIEKVKTDWYWDLQVPGTNNYVSGGAVHHNSGKSTFSHLATIRMLYEASCLKNPAVSYGLSPNSVIGFCNLAKSKQTARKVVFEGIVEKLAESPYFKYDFAPLKNLKEEILFPKNLSIIAGSSTDTSVIGMNIFGGIFDEGNFMREAAKKTKANMANQKIWGNQSKAGRLFEAVQRRMKSRYMTKGKLPGVLIVVSSKTTHDSFTEQLIRKAQASGSTSTFVRDRNVIDMKRDVFEDETFRVLVGSELYPSKILDKDESKDKYPGGIIIDIPVDFLDDFKENIGDALRDIAGVSTMAISQFMKEPGKIDAMDDGREHPFMCALMGDTQQWDSRLPYKIHWDQIARRLPNGDWEPKLNPHAKRHVHFDPALTGDAFGIVVGHIEGTVPVLQSGLGHGVYEHQPVFVVDFVLRIQGEPGEEVLFKAVRQLCYGFSHHGFHLAEFTMDTYQSREMVQALREQGYKAGIYSVDTGIGSMSEDGSESSKERQMEGAGEGRRKQAYRYLRQTIMDGRIKSYRYPVLFEELKRLEDGPVMIDHPENGSKDCADALAGCIWTLFRADYYVEPLSPVLGESVVMSDNVDFGMMVNENFEPRKVHGDAIEVKNPNRPLAPRDYEKRKGPKTLKPTYRKIGHDGSIEDLTMVPDEIDLDNYITRG